MLLSIVIPTKGRTEYLIEVVNTLLKMGFEETEIVIQDNNEKDVISKEFVDEIKRGEVVYNHSKTPKSFIANFEKAISLARGEYITIIGDDDIVNPQIENAIKKLTKQYDFDVAIPNTRSLFYIWPDTYSVSKSKKLHAGKGLLTSRNFSGRVKTVNAKKEVSVFFNNGCLDYLDTNMPRIYHGVVRRSLVKRIKDKYGFFFGGLTPDIYAAVILSLHANSVISVDYPLTIPGACKKSGSAASETGAHTGILSIAPHFNYRGEYTWNSKVPAIYTVETIWADSALAVLSDTNNVENYIVNLEKLKFVLGYKYPELKVDIEDKSWIGFFNRMRFLLKYVFKKKILWKAKKISEKLRLSKSAYIQIDNLDDVVKNVNQLEAFESIKQ